jgi:transcriptional regulator with XRE-family HTH domain
MGIIENIAANIKYYRHLANISQEELASRCGLHRTYIGSVERGERNVSAKNIESIAHALEIDAENLVAEPKEQI